MRKRYETVIYDLDGTLLNTLEDLANAVNHAMRESGYPERTLEEVCRFVGNGVGQLIHRALPASADGDEEAFEETLQAFKSYYARHNNDTTAPYDGIEALLERLNQAGVRQAIVSNKNDPNVKALTQDYFSRWIPLAVGEQEGVRRKPAPDTVLRVMKEWGCKPSEVLYVGDSDVDVETAHNANLPCCGAVWGFRTREELNAAGAEYLAENSDELYDVIMK